MQRSLALGWLLFGLIAAAEGCGVSAGNAVGCDDSVSTPTGETGSAGPCAAPPSEPPPSTCAGQCVAKGDPPWSPTPVLLWIGQDDPPPCPTDRAPDIGFEGFANPEGEITCDTCKCAPPTGTCVLPTTMTVSSEACPGDGPTATHTSFDAPASWGGGCTSVNGIPAGQTCGAGPCVKSLTIDPPQVQETDCAVVVDPVPKLGAGEITFKTHARQCKGAAYQTEDGCNGDLGRVCVPSAEPPPPSFHQCIWQGGEIDECPTGAYSERFVFYQKYEDQRTCSPCSCGKPDGSVCSAQVVLYGDAACSNMFVVQAISSADPATCQDLPAGSALLGKAAINEKYTRGSCQPSGGVPGGEIVMKQPTTFCCMPSGQ